MRITKALAVVTVLCLMAGTAQAYVWNNVSNFTGAGEWDNAANWDNGKPGTALWGGGDQGDPDLWWDSIDGYIAAGDVTTCAAGSYSMSGGSGGGFEVYQSGGSVSFKRVQLMMCWVRQSRGAWAVGMAEASGRVYMSREGGHQNGPAGADGSGHVLTNDAQLIASNIYMGFDLPNPPAFPATITQHDTSSVVVSDQLELVSTAGAGPALYTVGKDATLDVDLDDSSTGITVNTGGVLTATGRVECSNLTINGTGQVIVGGSIVIHGADKLGRIQGYIDAENLTGVAEAIGDNVVVTPEPATMCLLAIGGLGVLVRRRRR